MIVDKNYKYKFLSDGECTRDEDPSEETCWPCDVIRIPSRAIAIITVFLPLSAFIFSIFWAFHTNYRSATLVYCHENQVFNYLPSLSAAIGDFSFSKKVWIISVTLHAPPRFLYAYMYQKYLTTVIYKRYSVWVGVAFFLNLVENIGLLGLSFISSKASLPLHAMNFTIFIISSELYMLTMCILLYRCRNIPCVSSRELKSHRIKLRLFVIILSCSVVLPYVYHRHNAYCEEGVYTIFALLEYIVVICNMGFHLTAYYDFYDTIFKIHVGKRWRKFYYS
ncbi:unnamed protein product [Allacma fusca]|uniref:CWH43-like N-terminal domain-containing protein n=1 Tax=Allacma fusca TaxID=39272 RepID=A0A8J2KXG0_9HEXA|nr:unnamed protein product [Allacma fusca]